MLMVKHSSLKEDTAKAKEAITKTRNKRYTKTRPKKSKIVEPVLPEPKWWQKNSFYRLLCCQNICYSAILYIALVVFLALFAYAIWRICDLYIISKARGSLTGSHDAKQNHINSSGITSHNGEHRNHIDNDRLNQLGFQRNASKLIIDSPGRNDHRKFQSNVLPKTDQKQLQDYFPRDFSTAGESANGPQRPQALPGDKRYIIPPSPPRFRNYDDFYGSGGGEVESWRAIRYNLLKNRLQLTTGSSYPTQNPYWKAWFMTRNNPFISRFLPDTENRISAVHDDNSKKDKLFPNPTDSIQSFIVNNPKKSQLPLHSDIQQATRTNTTPTASIHRPTMPNTYSKLLQDLFDKISALRSKSTTARPTESGKSINATVLKQKILSALAKHDIVSLPSGASPENKNSADQAALKPGSINATIIKSSTSQTTPTTKSTTFSTTGTTTKGTTMATTAATVATTRETTATRKSTTVTKGTITKSTSPAISTVTITTLGATKKSHKRKHNRIRTRKHGRKNHFGRHGSKVKHNVRYGKQDKGNVSKKSRHHKKSSLKKEELEQETSSSGISSGSDNTGGESGGGSGSGSGDNGSVDEVMAPEGEENVHVKKTSKSHKRFHGYVGLRERIKKIEHNKNSHKKGKKHNRRHASNSKKKSHAIAGNARNDIPKKSHSHVRNKAKVKHQKKKHHGGRRHVKNREDKLHNKKKSGNSNKHKFMKIIQRKLSRVKKKNQIANRLKNVQSKMKELMKRKHKKTKSHDGHRRDEITKVDKSKAKILDKPIKRKEEPKHWHKGHLSLDRCVTLKEFDHSHYIGLTKLWKIGQKNTFGLTECKRKSKHNHRYKCRRTFYRTRGHMGLKSTNSKGRRKLYLIVCIKETDLKNSLKDDSKQVKKVSIDYSYKNTKHEKKKHHKDKKRNHRHRRKHHENESSVKRNNINRHKKRKVHVHKHRKHLKRHHRKKVKRHHKHHKKKATKKRHQRVVSHIDDNDDDNDGESGSGSGYDNSGDEEERVERSTSTSNTDHLRRNRKKKHHGNHHDHNHHYHKRFDAHKKHGGLTMFSNFTTKSNISANNATNSQLFTEFVDLMKEMKQEIQNVSILTTKNHNAKFLAVPTNASHSLNNATLTNGTTPSSNIKTTVKAADPANIVNATNKSTNTPLNAGVVKDMVAQIVPAIMRQFQVKSLGEPTTTSSNKTNHLDNTKDKATEKSTSKATTATTITTTTTKPTTKSTVKTTKEQTTLKTTTRTTSTTKPHPTPHPTTHHPTTQRHKTVTHHHTTKQNSKPHPKTTAAPNLALILKGLKAFGLGPLGQHASTGKPSQVQKKSFTPSAPVQPKPKTTKVPSPHVKQPPLPPPIPKPFQLHNRFMMNVLCFGDSLTAGYHNHGKAFSPYGNHLRQLLTYSSNIPVNLKIKGIVGEMTHKQMVSRLPEVLGNNTSFDWVIILGGTNDILHVKNFADDQEFLGQLESVWQPRITKDIEKLHTISHNYNAHTMLLTIPENAIEAWPGYKILMTMRTKINNALRQYANQNRNKVALCDIAKKLPRHSLSPQQEALFWDDHLHMTPQGYNRMAEEVFKCLKPYLPNSKTMI